MADEQVVLSTKRVILWWEWRRVPFNALLLMIGIAAIVVFEIVMERALPPGEDAEEPLGLLIGVMLFAFLTNACFTLGWVVELLQRGSSSDPVRARTQAEENFRRGMWLSCLLTTGPVWFALLFLITNHPSR